MSTQPRQLSNEDFVQAGLYPGGTGIIKDIAYKLWDYDGKLPPDSVCAVYVDFHPTDGSNEGKPVPIYWSVGPGKDYQPDHAGGFVLGVGTHNDLHMNSNWHFVYTKFRDTCGLEKGKLSQQGVGIKALVGSEMTLTRMDQTTRDFGDDQQQQQQGEGGQGRGTRKRTILAPTRCKFAWEKGAKGKPAVAAKPAAAAATAAAPAPASTNGSGSGSGLSAILAELLTENSGTLDVSTLPKLINEKMGATATVSARMDMMKAAKNEELVMAAAVENSWTFEPTRDAKNVLGGILSV